MPNQNQSKTLLLNILFIYGTDMTKKKSGSVKDFCQYFSSITEQKLYAVYKPSNISVSIIALI